MYSVLAGSGTGNAFLSCLNLFFAMPLNKVFFKGKNLYPTELQDLACIMWVTKVERCVTVMSYNSFKFSEFS